jgi:poly-gamma-glutamate synthesis protein (capsule biosynthesis protein)
MKRLSKISLYLLMLFLTLAAAGCSAEVTLPTRAPTVEPARLTPPPTPMQATAPAVADQVLPTVPPPPTASPTVPPATDYLLSAAPGVPSELATVAQGVAAQNPVHFGWLQGQPGQAADLELVTNGGAPLARWIYAVAAPFATVADDISLAEVTAGWQAGSNSYGRLVVERDTAAAFESVWGPPGAGAQIVEPGDLMPALWAARPSWTIMPFDRLSPEFKVLRLDGQSPLDHGFDQVNYPLAFQFGLEGDGTAAALLSSMWPGPNGNRDPNKLSKVAMSGVTALGRATAYQMELGGITKPGVVVGPVLAAADIAHVSHEVSFAPDCPYPNPVGDPIFCARDSYLELLTSIGTDVVELTGNHVNDWGAHNLARSVDLYEMAGMQTFGGGRNLDEAGQPAIFEHNGNKIVFIGCNPVGPAGQWATADRAGSMPCNYDAFKFQIVEYSSHGYVVIATLQYSEFYHYAATPQQQADFQALADAGAAAVSGSQGHHAQGFGFEDGSFIHYGLGNLFFDQMQMLGTRQSFVDTYTIYDGQLISVELFTSLIENYCCPRAMSAAERADLLNTVFAASGW